MTFEQWHAFAAIGAAAGFGMALGATAFAYLWICVCRLCRWLSGKISKAMEG
jgi:uncharacterized membrane protein YhiD involved in acid resistance